MEKEINSKSPSPDQPKVWLTLDFDIIKRKWYESHKQKQKKKKKEKQCEYGNKTKETNKGEYKEKAFKLQNE